MNNFCMHTYRNTRKAFLRGKAVTQTSDIVCLKANATGYRVQFQRYGFNIWNNINISLAKAPGNCTFLLARLTTVYTWSRNFTI